MLTVLSPKLKSLRALTIVFIATSIFNLDSSKATNSSRPPRAKEAELLHACAVNLCGPAEKYLPTRARGPFKSIVPKDDAEFINSQLNPKFEKLFNVHMERMRMKSQVVNELTARAKKQPLSDDLKALLTTMVLLNLVGEKFPTSIEVGANGKYEINLETFTRTNKKLPHELINPTAVLMSILLNTDGFKSIMNMGSVNFDDLIKHIAANHSRPSNQQFVNDFLSHFLRDAKAHEERLGPFIFAEFDLSLIKNVANGYTPTAVEKTRVLEFIRRVFMFDASLDNATRAAALNLNLNLDQILELAEWPKRDRRISEVIGDTAQLQTVKDDVIGHCRKLAGQSLATAPSELRLRQSDALIEQVKLAASRTTKIFFTGSDLERANSAIRTTHFSPPANRAAIENRLRATLDNLITTEENINSRARNLVSSESGWQSLFLIFLSRQESDDKGRFLIDLRDDCDVFEVDEIKDLALSGNELRKVQTSWQTVMFRELGAGITAHELGHIVSGAVLRGDEAKRYQDARSCSFEKQKDVHPIHVDRPSLSRFTEEDWADVFAVATLRELKSEWPYSGNFSCALLDIDKETDNYTELSFVPSSGMDRHSAPLLRALQTQIGLGLPVPRSCVAALGTPERKKWAKKSCMP